MQCWAEIRTSYCINSLGVYFMLSYLYRAWSFHRMFIGLLIKYFKLSNIILHKECPFLLLEFLIKMKN